MKKLPTDRVLEESLDFDYSMSNSQDVTEALLMQVENQHRIEEKRKTPGARTPAGVRTRTTPGSATARGAGSANTARAAAAALASAADEHRSEKAAAAAMASAADELRADKDMCGGGGLASTAVSSASSTSMASPTARSSFAKGQGDGGGAPSAAASSPSPRRRVRIGAATTADGRPSARKGKRGGRAQPAAAGGGGAGDGDNNSSSSDGGQQGASAAAGAKGAKGRSKTAAARAASLLGDAAEDMRLDAEGDLDRVAQRLARSAQQRGGGRGGGGGGDSDSRRRQQRAAPAAKARSARSHLRQLRREHRDLMREHPAQMTLLASYLAANEQAALDRAAAAVQERELNGRGRRSGATSSDADGGTTSGDGYSDDDDDDDDDDGDGRGNSSGDNDNDGQAHAHFRVERACALAVPKKVLAVGGSCDVLARCQARRARRRARKAVGGEKKYMLEHKYAREGDRSNCTFCPTITKHMAEGASKARNDNSDDSDGEQGGGRRGDKGGARKDPLAAFVARTDKALRVMRVSQQRRIDEKAYSARMDKRICPSCGSAQSFDELVSRKKECQNCNVEFRAGTIDHKTGALKIISWGQRDERGLTFLQREAQWRAATKLDLERLRKEVEDDMRAAHSESESEGDGHYHGSSDSDGISIVRKGKHGKSSSKKKKLPREVVQLQRQWAQRVSGRGTFLHRVDSDINQRRAWEEQAAVGANASVRDEEFVYELNKSTTAPPAARGWVHRTRHRDTPYADLFHPKVHEAKNAFLFKSFHERMQEDIANRQAREREFQREVELANAGIKLPTQEYVDPIDGGHEDIDLWDNDENTVNQGLARSLRSS
jgi:hypothetical protein